MQNTPGNHTKTLHTIRSVNHDPVLCPMPEDSNWNLHPRVFLSVDEQGLATCPYCSTRYQLKKGAKKNH